MKRTSGLTLIEMVVVIMILVGLAGILTPVIIGEVEKSKTAKAAADLKLLAGAFNRYRVDTGYWPPKSTPAQIRNSSRYVTGFVCFYTNRYKLHGWDGPYLPVGAGGKAGVALITRRGERRGLVDPWGRYYRLFTFKQGSHMGPGGGIVLVCTGPNGKVDSSTTDIANGQAQKDDLVYVVTRKL